MPDDEAGLFRPLSPQQWASAGQAQEQGKVRSAQFVAHWDRADVRRLRSSPHFTPRLCQVNVSRLDFLRSIPEQPEFVVLVVRMTGPIYSSRTLKCDKIAGQGGGLLATPLDLSFLIQYSHNIRYENNLLQIAVCRRKTRTRTLKSIAVAFIRMEEVVQNVINKKLLLYSPRRKDGPDPVCRVDVAVSSISAADEFERQSRNIVGDLRDELNFLSDDADEWDEEERQLSASAQPVGGKAAHAGKGAAAVADATTQRRGIRSKLTSLLLRRGRRQIPGEVVAGVENHAIAAQLASEYAEPLEAYAQVLVDGKDGGIMLDDDLDTSSSGEEDFLVDAFNDQLFSDEAIDSEPEDSDSSGDG